MIAAQKRYERARAINTLFGRAAAAWNAGERAQATQLFGQYINAYPKSPWSGEALLHLGYDAKENGRLIEAQELFRTIADKTSDTPNEKLRQAKRERKKRGGAISDAERNSDIDKALAAPTLEEAVMKLDSSEASDEDDESFEVHMKAKQQLADVDLLMGHFDAASEKLSEIVAEDTDWRRRTWASSQWQRASFLKSNAEQLMACGPQALGKVLVALNKTAGADKMRNAKAPRAQGFSLAELKTLAHQNGVQMRGFRAPARQLAQLPLPAILRYEFGPDQPVHSKVVTQQRSGHFVVLQGVDAKNKMVRLFDPLQERTHRMSYAQLQRQWSGQGLALDNKRVHRVGAELSVRAMRAATGGSLSSVNRNIGRSANNLVSAGGPSDYGSPVVEINRFSMNTYVHDTPLWYQPSRGPAVEISLSFNSQDALNQQQNFGRKWMFNYKSYAYEAYGGVIVVMPDASTRGYMPGAANPNKLEGSKGDYSYIEKSADKFVLVFQDGSRWVYQRTPATLSFLSRVEDAWGYGLNLNYNSSGQLATITDADGKNTTLTYNADNLITRVQDPFGRAATFVYFNNHLMQATDMEGQVFNYTYGGPQGSIARLDTPHGSWTYSQTGPYPARTIDYGNTFIPADPSMTITATNPVLDKEKFDYKVDDNGEKFAYSDYKGYGDAYFFDVGVKEELLSRTEFSTGDIYSAEFNDKDQVHLTLNARHLGTEFTYNDKGQILTVKDPKGNVTTLGYDANGVDVTSVTNANGVQTMSATYNAQHQPLTVTDSSSGGTTSFSYTEWGAPATVTDAENRTTGYSYGTTGNNLRRLEEVRNLGIPTGNGIYNYTTLNRFSYDNMGRVQTTTDAAGLTIGYQYDLVDRVTDVIYPDNTRETTTYLDGLPVISKDRHGRLSYAEYDTLQRVKRTYTQDAQNNAQVGTMQMGYDKNGNLISLTDTNGNVTRWSYDKRNRNSGKQYHDGKTETYTYFRDLLTQTTGTRGQIIKFEYDYNGNQTKIDYPNTPDVLMSYNKLDDVAEITDAIGTHVLGYDAFGRLLSDDGPLTGDTQTYAYDGLQRLQTQTVQRGASSGVQSQSYAYDGLGRLASLNANGTQGTGLTTYSYDGNTDRLRILTHPNGTKADLRYDGLGRLTHVFNGANGDLFYNRYSSNYDTRDIKINTQSRTGSGSTPYTTTFYSYDALDQLKQERVVGGDANTPYTTNYNYDGMGNRTQVNRASASASSTTNYTPNALNQLTSLTTTSSVAPTSNTSQTYDNAGNLTQSATSDGGTTTYEYDDADRLSRITRMGGVAGYSVSEFVYDYASRRAISRETKFAGDSLRTEEKRRIFDGLDVIQERNADNEVTAQLVRDGNIGGILSRTTAQGAAFYGYDGQGNVTLLTNAAGQDVGHYRYDAFGQTLEAVGPRAAENPYRFSTKELHAASGLYDFGYRFYSPAMGRWLNRDPISEEGGVNLYAMVDNNPVNSVDEYGLHPSALTV